MNAIAAYDPETYHATLTQSVYVRLEGSTLRLSKPNHNITRRADAQRAQTGRGTEPPGRAEGSGERESPPSLVGDLTLYLFGRTGREKEEWFQRILRLRESLVRSLAPPSYSVVVSPTLGTLSSSSRRGSTEEAPGAPPKNKELPVGTAKTNSLLDYSVYMTSLMPGQGASPVTASSPLRSPQNSPEAAKKVPRALPAPAAPEEEQPVAWLNAMLGRLLWDFLGEAHWAEMVSKKIQMKLSKIRLPYFMNELTLTELDMGVATPRILGASQPSVDHRGLWFDLDIAYSGSFLMTLETKMNLIRLGKEEDALRIEPGKDGYRPRAYCLADSDEESSSAGSSDEEDPSELSSESMGAEGFVGGHKPSKIMKFVDKITKSKYFQKATETEFIKKKMEEVSNTPLVLTVEAQELRGRLAVNIPPPPTDRIWYGFRTPPHLELKARPKLGEREVTFAHVTDWIEKKLYQEKSWSCQNMDDVWLTIMHSAMDPRTFGAANQH
uniref:SMP-LTD domain-containing protein n=2 Tax=Gadus morhua TaxID=8049 RepID=A0A8C4ZSS5_GADMO